MLHFVPPSPVIEFVDLLQFMQGGAAAYLCFVPLCIASVKNIPHFLLGRLSTSCVFICLCAAGTVCYVAAAVSCFVILFSSVS